MSQFGRIVKGKKYVLIFFILFFGFVSTQINEVDSKEVLCGFVFAYWEDPMECGGFVPMEGCDGYIYYLRDPPSSYMGRYMMFVNPEWMTYRCEGGGELTAMSDCEEAFYIDSCSDCGESRDCEEWLHIKCNVGGYKLYIDGEYILTEDGDGNCGAKLTPGTYSVKLKKDGCDTVTKTAAITCGKSTTLNVTMNCGEKEGNIKVYVEDENGRDIRDAKVYLDGNYQGETDSSGIYKIYDIPEGLYTIKAKKTGYQSDSETVRVTGGEWTYTTLVLKMKCEEGWECTGSYEKAYRNSDCSLSTKQQCPYGCENGSCVSGPPEDAITASIHVSETLWDKGYGISYIDATSDNGWRYFRTLGAANTDRRFDIPCNSLHSSICINPGEPGIPVSKSHQPIHFIIRVKNDYNKMLKTEFDIDLSTFDGDFLSIEIDLDENRNELIVIVPYEISVPRQNDLTMKVSDPKGSSWNWIPWKSREFSYDVTLTNTTSHKEIAIANIGINMPSDALSVEEIEITSKPQKDMFVKNLQDLKELVLHGSAHELRSWIKGTSLILQNYSDYTEKSSHGLLNFLINSVQKLIGSTRYDGLYWAEPCCSSGNMTGFMILEPGEHVTYKVTVKEKGRNKGTGTEPVFYASYVEAEQVIEIEGIETLQHWVNFMIGYEWGNVTDTDIGLTQKIGEEIPA